MFAVACVAWDACLQELDRLAKRSRKREPTPDLQNSDGDVIVMHEDSFDYTPDEYLDLRRRLFSIAGAENEYGPEKQSLSEKRELAVVILRDTQQRPLSVGQTVFARLTFENGLIVHTNSKSRSRKMREHIADVASDLVTYRSTRTFDINLENTDGYGHQQVWSQRPAALGHGCYVRGLDLDFPQSGLRRPVVPCVPCMIS